MVGASVADVEPVSVHDSCTRERENARRPRRTKVLDADAACDVSAFE